MRYGPFPDFLRAIHGNISILFDITIYNLQLKIIVSEPKSYGTLKHFQWKIQARVGEFL
jgi:hypothetical protein